MGKKRILLIEDNPYISDSLSKVIIYAGFDIIIAYDGQDGLEKAKQEKPDLIILDLKLPKLPGEEVCRQIKKDTNTQTIPIIMQTGKTSDVDRVVGRIIGADCYLVKPYDLKDLITEINRLIS